MTMTALAVVLSMGLAAHAHAEFSEQMLDRSIVAVQAYRGGKPSLNSTGFVVSTDTYNGFVVTNASVLASSDSVTVGLSGSAAELVAQELIADKDLDLAVLKVNGLSLPALAFAMTGAKVGDIVWSAVKWDPSVQSLGLAKGTVRGIYQVPNNSSKFLQHDAIVGRASFGSVLLNECGEVVGFNLSNVAQGSMTVQAIDAATLRELLGSQNIGVKLASKACISEIAEATQKAEFAALQAQRAESVAAEASRQAAELSEQVRASDARNRELSLKTQAAQLRADKAISAAAEAQKQAQEARQEVDTRAASIMAATEAKLKVMQSDRIESEEKFRTALEEQSRQAETRERITLAIGGGLLLLGIVFLVLVRGRKAAPPADDAQASKVAMRVSQLPVADAANTDLHHDALSEYVLDGEDERGMRYLLRISGDQLLTPNGVVIGRNPPSSPHVINHADVSRSHARMKVMKHRLFIEDLGSTNGTMVNGNDIESKGLVSIGNGDQIMIGSILMKLRVLDP